MPRSRLLQHAIRCVFEAEGLPPPPLDPPTLDVLIRDFEFKLVTVEPGWLNDPLRCAQCAQHICSLVFELASGERYLVPVAPGVSVPVRVKPDVQCDTSDGTIRDDHGPNWPGAYAPFLGRIRTALSAWSAEPQRAARNRAFCRSVASGGSMLRWRVGEVQRFARAIFEENGMPVPQCPIEVWYQLFRECDASLTALDERGAADFAAHIFKRILSFHGVTQESCAGHGNGTQQSESVHSSVVSSAARRGDCDDSASPTALLVSNAPVDLDGAAAGDLGVLDKSKSSQCSPAASERGRQQGLKGTVPDCTVIHEQLQQSVHQQVVARKCSMATVYEVAEESFKPAGSGEQKCPSGFSPSLRRGLSTSPIRCGQHVTPPRGSQPMTRRLSRSPSRSGVVQTGALSSLSVPSSAPLSAPRQESRRIRASAPGWRGVPDEKVAKESWRQRSSPSQGLTLPSEPSSSSSDVSRQDCKLQRSDAHVQADPLADSSAVRETGVAAGASNPSVEEELPKHSQASAWSLQTRRAPVFAALSLEEGDDEEGGSSSRSCSSAALAEDCCSSRLSNGGRAATAREPVFRHRPWRPPSLPCVQEVSSSEPSPELENAVSVFQEIGTHQGVPCLLPSPEMLLSGLPSNPSPRGWLESSKDLPNIGSPITGDGREPISSEVDVRERTHCSEEKVQTLVRSAQTAYGKLVEDFKELLIAEYPKQPPEDAEVVEAARRLCDAAEEIIASAIKMTSSSGKLEEQLTSCVPVDSSTTCTAGSVRKTMAVELRAALSSVPTPARSRSHVVREQSMKEAADAEECNEVATVTAMEGCPNRPVPEQESRFQTEAPTTHGGIPMLPVIKESLLAERLARAVAGPLSAELKKGHMPGDLASRLGIAIRRVLDDELANVPSPSARAKQNRVSLSATSRWNWPSEHGACRESNLPVVSQAELGTQWYSVFTPTGSAAEISPCATNCSLVFSCPSTQTDASTIDSGPSPLEGDKCGLEATSRDSDQGSDLAPSSIMVTPTREDRSERRGGVDPECDDGESPSSFLACTPPPAYLCNVFEQLGALEGWVDEIRRRGRQPMRGGVCSLEASPYGPLPINCADS